MKKLCQQRIKIDNDIVVNGDESGKILNGDQVDGSPPNFRDFVVKVDYSLRNSGV